MFAHIPQLPEMLDFLERLVKIESPSHDKAGVDLVGSLVAAEAEKLGATIIRHPETTAGDNWLARWGESKGGILMLCHMDTVFPIGTLEHMPFYEKNGKLFGPGVLDMKGGIVIALKAVEALQRANAMPDHPIKILFTSDEESGSHTSRPLIEMYARESDMVFVLESAMADGSLKTWRKGVGGFTVKVKGRAAHSGGDHQKGCNAIEEMAHQVLAIQAMTDYKKGTTLNVGVIRGGTVSNVVPDEAVVKVDLRVLQPEEWERVNAAMQALKPVLDGTSIQVSGNLNRPPMPATDLIMGSFEKAKTIAAQMNLTFNAGGTGGGSDGNFVAPLGIPLLDGLGPSGENYHSEEEYLFIDSLFERTHLMALLLRDWMK